MRSVACLCLRTSVNPCLLAKLGVMWATASPVEFDIEEIVPLEQFVLSLPVDHHVMLDNALLVSVNLHEELQEERSVTSVATSSVSPYG